VGSHISLDPAMQLELAWADTKLVGGSCGRFQLRALPSISTETGTAVIRSRPKGFPEDLPVSVAAAADANASTSVNAMNIL
jgi:hypothetical protein